MYARSIKNPIASTTSYRFNVKMDKRTVLTCKQARNEVERVGTEKDNQNIDELHNVCEHELLFRLNTNRHNHRIECFSALNGLHQDQFGDLQFVGIAVTGCSINSPMAAQGFTAARAGLHTIINTGNRVIEAGEQIYWGIPNLAEDLNNNYANSTHLQGVPKTKRCAMILNDTDNNYHNGHLGMAPSKAAPGQPMILLN